jgi:hypothetical protein
MLSYWLFLSLITLVSQTARGGRCPSGYVVENGVFCRDNRLWTFYQGQWWIKSSFDSATHENFLTRSDSTTT